MTDDRIEYERRLAAVRAAMDNQGLDILVSGDSGDWMLPTGNAITDHDDVISPRGN